MTFDRESCPPRDVLIDAGSPGATAEARERVADHLITCTACSEEFRLLQAANPDDAVRHVGHDAGQPSPQELVRMWIERANEDDLGVGIAAENAGERCVEIGMEFEDRLWAAIQPLIARQAECRAGSWLLRLLSAIEVQAQAGQPY